MTEIKVITQKQLEELKAEIKAECIKELSGKDYHNPQRQSPFNDVRDKYTKYGGPLRQAFDTSHYQIWECIRRLSTMAVGCQYVRDFDDNTAKQASETAEKLCEYVIGVRRGVGLK